MAHFMVRWQYSEASTKSLVGKPHDRAAAAKALVEGHGGKLHGFYYALGDFDGLLIAEFPDHTAAAACSLTAGSSGGFSRLETTALLTAKEGEAAMKHAHDSHGKYKPPHG